jgi:hypothetical protein
MSWPRLQADQGDHSSGNPVKVIFELFDAASISRRPEAG